MAEQNQLPQGWSALPPGWSKAAPPAAASSATSTPSSAPAAQQSPGLLDQFANWGAKTFPNVESRFSASHPATSAADTAEEFVRPGNNVVNATMRSLTSIPSAAADWVKAGLLSPSESRAQHNRQNEEQAAANGNKLLDPHKAPAIEPGAAERLATDTAGGLLAGGITGEATGSLLRAPGAAKDFVRGPADVPTAGSTTTPRMRYNAAKRVGVNLDAAEATGSPLLGNVKRIGENSLAGGHIYDAAKGVNTGALTGATDDLLSSMYNGDRESGGKTIQDALKRDQTLLHQRSEEGFESLPQDIPVPGLQDVGKRAQSMGKENAAYQNLFPSLKPTRAMSVVGDVGGLGPKPAPPVQMSPFVDESGAQIPSSVQPKPPPPHNFSTAQKLRSDLLEFTRKNPDIVAGPGDALVRQLTGGVDDAMTDASTRLTPAQLSTFRRSNADWRDMKETYDDPSSPFYHAVRTDNPSTLFSQGVGPKTPENALNLRNRLSPIEDFTEKPSPALGAMRRGTVESALKPNNEGAPNFRTFGMNLNKIPADYRAELFSPDQNSRLRDINHTANAISKDFNPSGSGKLIHKAAEGAALGAVVPSLLMGHPLPLLGEGLYHAGQYGAARLMNSPGAVDWLMRPSARPGPLLPAAAAGGATRLQRN